MEARPTETGGSSRRYRLVLGGIVLAGLLLRVAVYLDRRAHDPDFDSPGLDSRAYLDWAGRIAWGDVLGDRPFFLNPLYAYVLAPVVRLAGPDVLDATRALQTLLGLGTILLVAAATRRLAGIAPSLVAAALAAAHGSLHFYEQVVMIVTLAVFLNALLLYVLARFAGRPTRGAAFAAGLVLGAAMLARPNVALFALLLPLWFVRLAPAGAAKLRFAAGRALLVAGGSVVVILPVTVRNWIVGHDLVFVTSSSGVNLYQANNPVARRTGLMFSTAVRGNPLLVESDARDVAEAAEGRALRASEVSRYWSRRTLREAAAEPGAALGFLGRKFLFFLDGYEISSTCHYEAERKEVASLGLNPFTWTVLSPLALVGIGFVVRRERRGLPWVLLMAAYAAGLSIYFPLGHYRAPVLPAALPLAAVAVTGGWSVLHATGWRGRAALALAVSGAVAATNVPGIVRALDGPAWRDDTESLVAWEYNRGLLAIRRGDLSLAEERFERARRLQPESVLPEQGLADVAMARGDLAAEARHLEEVLRRSPDDPATLARYGLVLYDQGLTAAGASRVERAAALGPSDWIVFSVLGGLRERQGRFGPAIDAYEHAVACGLAESEVLPGIARCLRASGRPEEALRRLDRGLRRWPDRADLRLEKALALIAAGATDGAAVRAELRYCEEAGLTLPPEVADWLMRHP